MSIRSSNCAEMDGVAAALNAVCPYYTMFLLAFPLGVLPGSFAACELGFATGVGLGPAPTVSATHIFRRAKPAHHLHSGAGL